MTASGGSGGGGCGNGSSTAHSRRRPRPAIAGVHVAGAQVASTQRRRGAGPLLAALWRWSGSGGWEIHRGRPYVPLTS